MMKAKIPLVLEPQPEGGYTATSPLLPELLTEGDTVAETLANKVLRKRQPNCGRCSSAW